LIRASAYIAWCSAKNRARVRLRRLREPRYLIGAVAGIAYFYFAIFAPRQRAAERPGRGRTGPVPPLFQIVSAPIVGVVLFAVAILAWLLPSRSGLLDFSEAETALLFPAPVSRRQLLVHRVVRSQVGSLIASVFIGIFATPISALSRVRVAIGFWVLLVTMRVYYAGVTLTRARLQTNIAAIRRRAWAPIALLAAGLAVVAVSIFEQFAVPAAGVSDVFVRFARATSTGLPRVVLWPFVALIRAPFAGSTAEFVYDLGPALVVLVAVTAWMLTNDDVFDFVVGPKDEERARAEARPRAPARARDVGWTLPLTGRPELALMWKGSKETFRGVSAKTWRYLLPAFVGVAGMSFSILQVNELRGPASAVSVIGAMIAAAAILLGPQIARGDLRTDFVHLDLLKTWPMRAADVIRGEMAWPATIVSFVLWGGLFVSALFSSTALPDVSFVNRWSFAIAAAIAGPALIAAQYAVHNVATILFPAWVQIGPQRTRGIDAMGQPLIMLAAVVISLAAFAVPGVIGGGVVWFLFNRLVGNVVFVPAAIVFSAIVLVEVLAVTELLGPAYERIDITSIERPE